MPGFTHPRHGTAGALAIALAVMFAPLSAHAAPQPSAAGPARARAAAARVSARLQPGGPLARGHDAGDRGAAPTFARSAGALASTNWAGYAAVRTHEPFRYVESALFVPYLDCSATPDAFSAHWVGLDGENTSTVEQAGVLADCQGSTPRYAAWYEMFPEPPVYVNLAVRPGDSIVASVYYRRGDQRFTLSLTDTTTGGHFATTRACPSGVTCERASAEIISEAPSSSGHLLPLADFRALSYSGAEVTDQPGHRSGLRSKWWDYQQITTVSPTTGAVVDEPTQLYRGGAFDNYWTGTG